MSVFRSEEMATDRVTEEQLSENIRKSVVNMTGETEQYQGESEVSGDSSGSLCSSSESVSITMSDSDISAAKEEETRHITDWDAADKEYMDIHFYSEEGCNGNMNFEEHDPDKEFIDLQDSSEVMNEIYLPKIGDPKEEPDLQAGNVFLLTGNISQSDEELTIQKQNRIRSRIQVERSRSGQADDRDSGIYDTGRFDNTEQFDKEAYERESTNKLEIKCQYQGKMQEAKPFENNPKTQLEQQDKIIEDLEDLDELIQCHLTLANGAEVDEIKNSKDLEDSRGEDRVVHSATIHLEKTKNKHGTDLENQFNSLLEELIMNLNSMDKVIPNPDEIWQQSPPERRSDTEIKFHIYIDDSSKTNQDNKQTSTYHGYSQDASTQTEKIKKVKRCQIM